MEAVYRIDFTIHRFNKVIPVCFYCEAKTREKALHHAECFWNGFHTAWNTPKRFKITACLADIPYGLKLDTFYDKNTSERAV